MLNDAVNYVRQGVLIASALICIQHTEATCPKVCYLLNQTKIELTHETVLFLSR